MKREPIFEEQAAGGLYASLREKVALRLGELARCRSDEELLGDPLYQALREDIEAILHTPDMGCYRRSDPPARAGYRVVAWNLERGIELEGQLEALRGHAYLRAADVFLLTETDLGMARSGNRAVAQEIARALACDYAFGPCYLNLTKGSGVEYDVEGENELGLHGNAIVSRYPIRHVRLVPLRNGIDKMARREKRIGRQVAMLADIQFPNLSFTVASLHLDAQSTQAHRRSQMAGVLEHLPEDRPVLLGGDWNTSTYNSSHAFFAILGFWLRVFMGVDHVIRNHYLHPERHFERELFTLLEENGFDYRRPNRLGEGTFAYDFSDHRTRKNLGEWVPGWCFPFIHWSLRNH